MQRQHKSLNYLTLLLFVVSGFFAQAQVSFEARVSKKKLGLNERLRVDFVMNENGDNFIPPSFDGFRVVGGPQQSISNTFINGKRSFSKTFTYFLNPKEQGTLTIAAAEVTIQGDVYKTEPISIAVSKAIDRPRGTNDVEYLVDENLHLVAEISNTKPYLNEGINVVYKLYFRSPIKVSDAREIESPKFVDFWTYDIKIPQLKIERGTYKGEPYSVVVWKKMVLYPQKTGKLALDPLTLNIMVDIPTNRRDFFGNTLYKQVNRTITAGRRNITTKALPTEGQPENFSGAVGTFDFDVLLNKDVLKASESFQLRVKIKGKGNLSLFELPEITAPNSLEVYEPEYKDNINVTLRGMQGVVENTYTIVPQYQGKFPIPEVSFSYFDPKAERYKTLSSQSQLVNVFEGPSAAPTSASPAKLANNVLEVPTDGSFKFIKLKTAFEPTFNAAFYKSKPFYLLSLAPFLLLGVFLVVRRGQLSRAKDVEGLQQRKANQLARKFLSEAKKQTNNHSAFYEALERALHNYLKAKIKLETTDYSKAKILELLQEKAVVHSDAQAFVGLLENCDLARFTPATEGGTQDDYNKAVAVISRIDKSLRL